jgi:cytoskeleton protein RodZ
VFQIGTSLREARLRQGLDLLDAETATKIRSKYLQALEEEQFDVLPAPTYVKGFLRNYAEYLGLDGELYVDEYNSRYVQGEDEPPRHLSRRSASAARAQRRVETGALVLALAGIIGAAGLVFLAWQWAAEEPARIPASPPSEQPAAVSPPPAKASKRPWIKLTLTAASGATELTVYRGAAPSGKPLFDGTLVRGRTMPFTGPRLWFRAGRPGVLRAEISGHPTPIQADPSRAATLLATREGVVRAPE